MIKHEDIIKSIASKALKLEKEIVSLKKTINLVILTQVFACIAFVVFYLELHSK